MTVIHYVISTGSDVSPCHQYVRPARGRQAFAMVVPAADSVRRSRHRSVLQWKCLWIHYHSLTVRRPMAYIGHDIGQCCSGSVCGHITTLLQSGGR